MTPINNHNNFSSSTGKNRGVIIKYLSLGRFHGKLESGSIRCSLFAYFASVGKSQPYI